MSKNVDNVDKICPKSSRARGGSPMVWLTARRPGAIHGKGWVSDLLQDHLWRNWIDQITLNRPPNQPWTITRRSQEHLRSFHVWQTSRSPVYRTLICTLPSSWLYMLCAQHPIEALNCMRQRYSFVFARVTSPLYCLLRSSDLFESEIWSWVGILTWTPRWLFTWLSSGKRHAYRFPLHYKSIL